MPKRTRKADFSQTAHSIVQRVTGQSPATPERVKNTAAVELGRLGGLKGGRARADKMSPEQRRAGAQKAAISRWSNRAVKE